MVNLPKIKQLLINSRKIEEVFAAEIGMSQSHFSNCLHGKRQFSKATLEKIARIYNCEVDILALNQPENSVQNKLTEMKVFHLNEEELENIKKIASHFELLKLYNDKEIRETYESLIKMITYRQNGGIACDYP
jgi:transcriptional regulator with XRE-family HTH domain